MPAESLWLFLDNSKPAKSTICYFQELARKSHQDSAVPFVAAKSWPEKATKTRQYDLLRPRVGQKEPLRLGSTICYGQKWAKTAPERATKTPQYEFLRPTVGQKEPPRLGSTIRHGQELARKSHRDSAVRFVTAKRGPERATKTRQFDLSLPRVGQKEPPRLGSTIYYRPDLAGKSHQDSAVRFVTAKRGPERATKTRQYDLLRPRVVARKSHQDSAVRFVTAKSCPERATKTRQYDLLRPRVGQKEPPRLGSTICYGQTWARKSHQDSVVQFVTANSWPETATKTRQYDLLRPRVGQKEPPRLGSTICYGQELARKSHQDSAVRFVTAKRVPERATKTRQYDLLRPNVGQNEPPRQYDLLRPRVGKKEPLRLGSTICYGQMWATKSHQDSAVRFVTAKRGPERASKTRHYDLLRPRVGQKEPPRLGSTICYGQELSRKSNRDSVVRFVTAKSSAVRFVAAKSGPERATKIRQYNLVRPNMGQKGPPRLGSTICYGQKEPPRLGSTICYGQSWARKSQRDSAVRFVTAKSWPERATETRQYDLLRPNVCQKKPPRLGSTICYGQTWARKSHQDCPEKAAKTRQYDLLRPRAGEKEPLRIGSTICSGRTWPRKSHQDSAVRFVAAKRGPERATETRQYDLLRPRVGQKEPPRLGSTICYGQELARKSHRDSAVRFVAAKRGPERATKTRQYDLLRPRVGQKRAAKTRQYDLLRPNVGQKEPPRLGSTTCYGRTWARKNHQDSAVRFVAAKRGPERATETRQYDLLRLRFGQKDRQYDL